MWAMMLKPGERLRGRAGQVARQRRLRSSHGLCEMCLDAGVTRQADEVDHITPLAMGGRDVDGNTRNLCREHHLSVTAQQFGMREVIGGRGVDVDGRPTGRDHPWNAGRVAKGAGE